MPRKRWTQFSPKLPGMDDHLSVAAGLEDVAQRLQLGHEFLEVVYLAVEHHRTEPSSLNSGC